MCSSDLLVAASQADYVSFIDDDDMVSDDFVSSIVRALQERPDMVGFEQSFTEDGVLQVPVHIDLRCGSWYEEPDAIWRDISHLAPIRRELARSARFLPNQVRRSQFVSGAEDWVEYGEDRAWVDQMRSVVKTQVYVPRVLYRYQHSMANFCLSERFRTPMTEHPPRPEYPFVTWL